MAEPVIEATGDQCAKKVEELKKELQRLVNSIVDGGEDYAVFDTNEAIEVLARLTKLKIKMYDKYRASEGLSDDVPLEFKCPLSRQIMTDPVILASGQTFDRPHIEKWLNEGNQKCPVTQNVLAHTVLIPNVLVHDMISEWCREHNVELSKCADVSDQVWTEFDTHNVNSLIQKMSSTLSERKEAARELRLLTKKSSSLRSAIGETDVIPLLLSTLKWDIVKTDYQFQEDLITTLLNLAIHVDNKGKIVDNPLAIPLLIEYLKSGAMETRRNAAATLFTLARTESSKNLIGQAGALKPLLDLVEEGNALAMKDALQAIVHLCTESNNKVTAVREGAIRVILKMITDDVLVEELAILLTAVASQEESIQEFEKLNAIPKLLGVIRNSNCLRVKEHCVSILYHICSKDPTKLADIRSDERANSTFSMLLLSEETDRTKRKVKDIISRIKKASGSSSSSSPRSLS